MSVDVVTEADLGELLALMRAYCEFYGVDLSDERLLSVSRTLLSDPDHEGIQLVARDDADPARTAVGFATVFWSWTTLRAGRLAVMNDLFVAPAGRGAGHADALIEECASRARARGCVALEWQTAHDNGRAQQVYDRSGAQRSEWVTYDLRL